MPQSTATTTSVRPLVLASASPRRRQLLATLGLPFVIRISDLDEANVEGLSPADYVSTLAGRKAEAVAWEQTPEVADIVPDRVPIVIGADTTVVLDGEILGKPADPDDAYQMLARLRGRSHEVLTGVATVDRAVHRLQRSVVRTVVTMRDYTDAEIATYVATGEPFDKAGGYGIQGKASQLIAGFDGCYTNVVGLPLCEVTAHLAALGISVRVEPPVCRLPSGEACPRLGQPPRLIVSEPTFQPPR